MEQALGNPLALVELPAAYRSSVARGICAGTGSAVVPLGVRLEQTFAGRWAELSSRARDVLLVAALGGEDTPAEIVAAAAALGGGEASQRDVSAVDEATAAGLLVPGGQQIRFRHPLVRSAVLQSESLHRRLAAHAALAQVLHDEPYRAVWHRAYATLGPDDAVADALDDQHEVSVRRGSITAAIAALERAAELSTGSQTRVRRLLRAAEYAFGLGQADLVDRLLAAASRHELTELDRSRMEWLREIFTGGVAGDGIRVRQLCAVARRAGARGDAELALNVLLSAAMRCWWADPGAPARADVVASADDIGYPQDHRHLAARSVSFPVEQSALVTQRLAAVVVGEVADPHALRTLGLAAHAVGDPVRSIELLDRAETRLREEGRFGLLAHVLIIGALDRLELGDWPRARIALEEAQRLTRETGQPIWDTGTLSLTALACALRGAATQAFALAAEAEEWASGRRLSPALACAQLARGVAFVTTGRHSEGYSTLRRLFDQTEACFHPAARFHALTFLAEAAVHAGPSTDVDAIVTGLDQIAESCTSTTLAVQLGYAHAVLAADADAEAHFTTALAANLTRWPWARARLQLAYGSWLRRRRRVAESREPLRNARTTLEAIGARTWAESARAELRAAGRPRRSTRTPVRPTCCPLRSCRSPGWSRTGCRTSRSPSGCSSHPARSARTCTASSPRSTSPPGPRSRAGCGSIDVGATAGDRTSG